MQQHLKTCTPHRKRVFLDNNLQSFLPMPAATCGHVWGIPVVAAAHLNWFYGGVFWRPTKLHRGLGRHPPASYFPTLHTRVFTTRVVGLPALASILAAARQGVRLLAGGRCTFPYARARTIIPCCGFLVCPSSSPPLSFWGGFLPACVAEVLLTLRQRRDASLCFLPCSTLLQAWQTTPLSRQTTATLS